MQVEDALEDARQLSRAVDRFAREVVADLIAADSPQALRDAKLLIDHMVEELRHAGRGVGDELAGRRKALHRHLERDHLRPQGPAPTIDELLADHGTAHFPGDPHPVETAERTGVAR